MNVPTRTLSAAALAAALSAGLLASATTASASGPGVRSTGACSHLGTYKLTAKHDDGAIEVEYEVDTNVVGQTFHVRLTDNGVVIARRTATTHAPSGSFSVAKRTPDRAGSDTIRAHATSGANACGGAVTL